MRARAPHDKKLCASGFLSVIVDDDDARVIERSVQRRPSFLYIWHLLSARVSNLVMPSLAEKKKPNWSFSERARENETERVQRSHGREYCAKHVRSFVPVPISMKIMMLAIVSDVDASNKRHDKYRIKIRFYSRNCNSLLNILLARLCYYYALALLSLIIFFCSLSPDHMILQCNVLFMLANHTI